MERSSEAAQHFEYALAMNQKMGARPSLAQTQEDYARLLLAHNNASDRERAHKLLEEALTTYRELGMQSYAARASTAKSPRE
jgi:hypothetical protein